MNAKEALEMTKDTNKSIYYENIEAAYLSRGRYLVWKSTGQPVSITNAKGDCRALADRGI